MDIYSKKKQKKWIWLCISKVTKRILAVYIGDRGENSATRVNCTGA